MAESDYLRRYTNIPSLVYLLKERKLTLLDPQSWNDRNDSHYMALYKEKRKLKTLLALCFSQSEETYHHWHVFASGSSGVCIRFKREALLTAISKKKGVSAGPVHYLTLDKIRNKTLAIGELPFKKRYAYQHENEYRIVYESRELSLPALDIPMPLKSIQRITLSPWIHPSLADHLKATLKSIPGCTNLEFVRSTLISNQEWRNLGDAAQ